MKVDGKSYRTIWFNQEKSEINIIDQTKLPHQFLIKSIHNFNDSIDSIKNMEVRGAPLIGAMSAYGITLAIKDDPSDNNLNIQNDNSDEDEKATFTSSIDKWQSDGMGDWMDGPVMKLHRKDIEDEVGIDLSLKDGHPGHKHKPDMDKGSYELRVEHTQQTDGAIDIDDVMGVLSLSRGLKEATGKEHELAADWNGDGMIDIDDVMGVLSRSRGLSKDDQWRFHDKQSDTSLWDNASKLNKMDIELDGDNEIELTAILRGDVNSSYDASIHNRTPGPNAAPLPVNNEDELLIINPDIV